MMIRLMSQCYMSASPSQERQRVSTASLQEWLEETRPKVNQEQFRFLALVLDRILVELGLRAPEASVRDASGEEPLRYLLHGPPGTGKSHVLKFVEALFEKIGYKKGLDWQLVAFQAANATDLSGETIHHAMAFSINFRSQNEPMAPGQAKRAAHWRWLFIDGKDEQNKK